jgi:hypothetical protein
VLLPSLPLGCLQLVSLLGWLLLLLPPPLLLLLLLLVLRLVSLLLLLPPSELQLLLLCLIPTLTLLRLRLKRHVRNRLPLRLRKVCMTFSMCTAVSEF